jgi:hypothetical protein
MLKNQTVWDYYPKDNSYYIDPMYVPYQESYIKTEDGICPVKTWKEQGSPTGFVNPALVRKKWGTEFMLMHPDTDSCPTGWTKQENGWCKEYEPEFGNNGLYSNDAFIAKYQYWDSYAPALKNSRERPINEFDSRSVNPFTGEYVVYHKSNDNFPNKNRYGSLPSKDSYLA